MIVLIPAYEPNLRLVNLVERLRAADPHLEIVVVDDGSGPSYAPILAMASRGHVTVLRHDVNRGKGAALRTGLAHVAAWRPGGAVVCADSDGQHEVTDILRVGRAVADHPGAIVLGVRHFAGDVPLRSRVGNSATRTVFRLASGVDVTDTQTGLRGYSADLIPWLLAVPGERFAYEMSVLVAARRDGRPIVQVPIATVYHDGNRGSHFRPLADSAHVYRPLIRYAATGLARFTASSLLAFAIDLVLLLGLMAATGQLLLAVVGARVVSSMVNFAVNRSLVFGTPRPARLWPAAMRYYALAIALLTANYLMLWALTGAGLSLLVGKLGTEASLFLVSFVVQRSHVFGRRSLQATPAESREVIPAAVG